MYLVGKEVMIPFVGEHRRTMNLVSHGFHEENGLLQSGGAPGRRCSAVTSTVRGKPAAWATNEATSSA